MIGTRNFLLKKLSHITQRSHCPRGYWSKVGGSKPRPLKYNHMISYTFRYNFLCTRRKINHQYENDSAKIMGDYRTSPINTLLTMNPLVTQCTENRVIRRSHNYASRVTGPFIRGIHQWLVDSPQKDSARSFDIFFVCQLKRGGQQALESRMIWDALLLMCHHMNQWRS